MGVGRVKAPRRSHTGEMITHDLAIHLAAAGLPWEPASGDRFAITTAGMEADVFHLADMVADLHRFTGGSVVGFNGTTEWALDMVELDHVVWLPREDQLRVALGDSFAAFSTSPEGYSVTLTDGTTYADPDAETAYGTALLAVLNRDQPA